MASDHTLLVTGANGYIGKHIIRVALARGYNVRATARSESSFAKIRETFPGHEDQLSFVVVKDITQPDNYKDAFAGVTGVIHTASPFILKPQDIAKELLDPAIQGSVAILEAAKKYGASVKHIISTSSFAAILDLATGYRPGYTYTEADKNPMTYEQAAVSDGATAYCASKGLAEQAMWDWVAANKPAFTLTALCPPWVFGPAVGDVELDKLGESLHSLWTLVDAKTVHPFDFGGFVDVRTIAEAHLLAYEKGDAAAGKRFLVGQHFDYPLALELLRKEIPELDSRLPKPEEKLELYAVDGSKAEKELGVKYIPLNVTLRDTFKQFLAAEAKA